MQVGPFVAVCRCCAGQVARKEQSDGGNLKGAFDDEGDPEDLSTR